MNLKKNRAQLLPEIRDWQSDHLHLKYCKNVKDQPYNVWFWFSADNYKLIKLGFPTIFSIFLGLGTLFCYRKGFMIPAFMLGLFTLIALGGFVKTIRAYPTYKHMNMYEVHLQDKPEDIWKQEVKNETKNI